MKVFEIIPGDFFSVLVSPNREIYVDALMKLYEMFQNEINIRLKAFLTEVEILLEDRVYIIEEGDDTDDAEPASLRGKARLIERRFEKTGWVEREFLDGSFTEIITPNRYAITVMRMLRELSDERISEYNSLVFSTYSALNQAYTDNRDRMYEALLAAKNNTEKLDFELRAFYHGIRGYLRVIRENTDVNLLLKNHFEEYKKMRKYVSREMTDAELLQSIGISRYPEPLEMRGNILVNGNDMSVLESGFCIYSGDIDAVQISIPNTVRRILTIENRANYFAYRHNAVELVIYHGGQYSPAKKKLFEKIAAAMPEKCVWYHWGDIDLGGFSMLLRLRKEILPSVQPYRMGKNELLAFQSYTQTFSKDYADKLRRIAENERLADCRECIDYMLEHKIKLEQEAMLT